MAGMLSQFSDVQLSEVYRFTCLEVMCAATAETAAPPASTLRVQRLFRSPYLLIEAVADFNRRHSAACVEKREVIPAADCDDPWGVIGERQLEAEVLATMRSITRLVVERWRVPLRDAGILADIAVGELRQRIREEYESGRDAHLQAMASLHLAQVLAPPTHPRSSAKRRRRSNLKAPIDRVLGTLEKRRQIDLRRDFSDSDTLHEKMAEGLYRLSAEDLEASVNAELEVLGIEPVSAKTISRSEKYKGWKPHRRRMPVPATAAADCGPAFNKPGHRAPTVMDVAGATAMADGFSKRSGHKLRSGGRTRSRDDRAADRWAESIGETLPPAE